MGWTFFEKPNDIKQWYRESFSAEHYKVLDVAIVNRTELYAAVQDTRTGFVVGCISLLQYTRDAYYNFGHKDMDEFCGPYATNCPERILRLLSPLDALDSKPTSSIESAQEWRNACWQKVQQRKNAIKLQHNDVIRFDQPFRFTGREYDTFIFTKTAGGGSRLYATKENHDGLYPPHFWARVPKWRSRSYTKIKAA